MSETRTEIGDIRYNAATASFEALVTVHTESGDLRVASSYAAPLDTEIDAAESALRAEALAGLDRPDRLVSHPGRRAPEPRPAGFKRIFGAMLGNRAA